MDSWPRRPFGLHSSRVPYTSTARVSSSSTSPSLGSSRLSSREMGLNSERFPRASSTYKTDLDQQTSCLRRSSRDFSSSDSRSTSWKLPPSLTSSTRSYDHPWAESSLSSRRKLTESEGRVGMRSALLNPSDDGDPNRSPLSYSSRGLYSRKPSTLLTGSSQSSNGLSSSRGEKQSDTSSWSSNHSRLSTRRDFETKNELGVTGLGDGRVRTGLASSLYPTERLTSTYAQGARPKETTYSPYSSSSSSSSSSTARESSLNRHTSSSTSHRSLLGRNLGNRTTSHYLNVSSTMRSSEERTGNPLLSSDMSSSQSSHTPRFAASQVRAEATPPHRPALDGDEPGSYRACRRLLSRIFSRQSSQDSSSGSSSVSSFDDNGSSSTDGDSTDGSRGARNCRAVLTSVHGNSHGGSRGGVAQPRMPSGREPGVGGHNNARNEVSASSWLSSAPPGRRSPLLSRRHARDDSAHSSTSLEGGYAHPQHLPRRWAYLQRNASQAAAEDEEEEEEDDEEDDEEEEEKEGAVGFGAYVEKCPCKLEEEALPEVQSTADDFSARRRIGMRENYSASSGSLVGVENVMDDEREKAVSSADQEKLRKIKERLLLEESDEEEGDLCRICQMGEESTSNPLIQPCHCTGSLQYVHQECIKRWLCSKIHSGTNLESVTTCELCKKKLHLSIDDFDVEELYRTYVQSECDNFISSSLHLVGRFFNALEEMDLAGFNLVRILHEQMENSEVSHSESEGEIQDNRPSISLSDLEDDSEEEF